jgi:sugar phosphate isomerase/epimerase
MYRQRIGVAVKNYGISIKEELQIIKNAGFDAISPGWCSDLEMTEIVNVAEELGLDIEYVHAPFKRAADLWSREKDKFAPALKEIFDTIDTCVKFQIPTVVAHVWIGFDYRFDKDDLYYDNFEKIVSYACESGVKIAFENTEGLEYLMAIMEHFQNNDTVGFCWDSGHEMCYNYSEDILGALGNRLMVTHLNDNLGISGFDGKIYWTDDLHLLPYDGVADWDDNIRRLKKAKRVSILNFELSVSSKPGRHENDTYARMTPVEFYTEAYRKACRIAYRYN